MEKREREPREPLLTIMQAATILGMKKSWLYKEVSSGNVPGVLLSSGRKKRTFRIAPQDLDAWLLKRRIAKIT
jgi:excisionase family DNA binding protein